MLKDKTIAVTGCLKGIGRAALDLFAENHADIFACAQHESEEFSSHIAELMETHGVSITPIFFDLTDEAAIKAGMKQIISSKKRIDGLVNIAGMTYNALFQMTSIAKMREVFEVDFFSQMLVTQYIAKVMLRQKAGSIVSVASIAGLDGNEGQVAYSAAKAALVGATRTLAAELGPSGIRVNAVAPGVIDTDMTRSLSEEEFAKILRPADLPRPGDPAEVAKVLMYLLSDLSGFVTGQIVRIDGGIGG